MVPSPFWAAWTCLDEKPVANDDERQLRESVPLPRLDHLLVLIPAWNPDQQLIRLVEDLVAYGFAAILITDDGSHPDSQPIFEHLRTIPRSRPELTTLGSHGRIRESLHR